jgi:hypothetical protein
METMNLKRAYGEQLAPPQVLAENYDSFVQTMEKKE